MVNSCFVKLQRKVQNNFLYLFCTELLKLLFFSIYLIIFNLRAKQEGHKV